MLRMTIIAAGLLATSSASIAGEDSKQFSDVKQGVSSFMQSEVKGIQESIARLSPILDCGCPHLCAMIGRIARGGLAGPEAEKGILIATQTDLSGGISTAVRNGGKFEPELMGRMHIKLNFAKGVDPKELADLVGEAVGAVLR